MQKRSKFLLLAAGLFTFGSLVTYFQNGGSRAVEVSDVVWQCDALSCEISFHVHNDSVHQETIIYAARARVKEWQPEKKKLGQVLVGEKQGQVRAEASSITLVNMVLTARRNPEAIRVSAWLKDN